MINPPQVPQIKQLADTVRGLSIDAIQKANSGHPGLPLGCADIGALLFTQTLKHNPADPAWIDRDRFVLSAGHGSMFIYSLLGLTGYGTSTDDMAQFRQFGSRCPGHPEFGLVAGVETTTGPLGAGFATAVGMAMAETRLAATFNTAAHTVIDHHTYVLAGDGCLQEGVSAEAASLAGHLGLGKLIVIYDSNHITIEGHTDVSFTEDVGKRFEAYGWQVLRADGYDLAGLDKALAAAKAEGAKPSLIIAKTVIGKGSPNKADSHEVHGAPLGADEVAATKKALGLDPAKFFQVPDAVSAWVKELSAGWKKNQADWQKTFDAWAKANPELLKLWDSTMKGTATHGTISLPAIAWPAAAVGEKLATRAASGKSLQAAAAALPFLIGGSADLAPSNNTELKGQGDYQKASRTGRNLHFGIREHAMGNIVNGLVLHGGVKAYGATFMVFSDYLRPSLRLAALMKIPSIFVLTHDSIWVGEDGPTHQPVEHLSSLRIIPGLETFRPADLEETTLAWQLSLEKGVGHHAPTVHGQRKSAGAWEECGPSALALTRQNLTVFAKPAGWQDSVRKTGAYVALDCAKPAAVVLASGSEVSCALEAAAALKAEGKDVRVISVPSLDRFRAAWNRGEVEGAAALVPAGAKLFAIEAADYTSWAEFVKRANFVGVQGFGECGPGETVAKHFGVTAQGLKETLLAAKI
jgi:transketolase